MYRERAPVSGHVWRPVLVVVAVVVLLLVVREAYVPSDFGVHEGGYTYGWYRERSIGDWKWATVKYQGKDSCAPCHDMQVSHVSGTPHAGIQCENCHGPAEDHPSDPKTLPTDRSRELCLRCHAKLPYPSSARGGLRGVDPEAHHPEQTCVECHLPHEPTLTDVQSKTSSGRHGNQYCRPCHQANVDAIKGMPHEVIFCESCHGKARNHPTDPPKLEIDRTRDLCVNCHVDEWDHNVGRACVTCHDPHKSSLQFLQFLP
jgi:predicted CXXCH cytochrome family protein